MDIKIEFDDIKATSVQEFLNFSKTKFEIRFSQENKTVTPIDDFEVIKTIGVGGFGRVFLVNHKVEPQKYLAMKVINKEQVERKYILHHVLNEKRFLTTLRHPFIIHMEYFAKDLCNLYFIMPFAVGGDLYSLLKKKGTLNEFETKFYSGQIVLAIEYLHTLDIIYRDLKPENVLIFENGYIKLADLGFCKRVIKRTFTMCGTSQYLAPEIIGLKAYGKPVDWWALGVVVFEMVAGFLPFTSDTEPILYEKISYGIYKIPNDFSLDFVDLVKNLLQIDWTKRLGKLRNGHDIKEHKWFRAIDWIILLNKQMEAPFVPSFNDISDTSNFEDFPEEKISKTCIGVDQMEFNDF